MALMGPGGSLRQPAPAPAGFDLACALLRDGLCADAYRLLLQELARPDRDRSPAVLYNLALCHLEADEPARALERLDEARALCKAPARPQPADETLRRLLRKQAAAQGYRRPVPRELPAHCPEAMGECLTRLLVDVCARLELWERVRALAAPMAGKGYDNIERALAQAAGATQTR